MNLRDFLKFIEATEIFSRNDRILLAVSGGIDSTVMAHLFQQSKFRFAIAHCNFCLRAGESDGDEVFVKNLAVELHVPFFSIRFDTTAIAAKKNISIQMAARELRYNWFEKIRQENGFDFVATAHHLDDQVETFMINLVRGTGIAGLHGIPVKHGTVIRPMMFAFRDNIVRFALRNQISYRTDASNQETKYVRNKIRHEVIPLLSSINPDFAHGLTDSIRRIYEFQQIGMQTLQEWCSDALTPRGDDQVIEISHLLKVSPREPYIWELLSPFGFNETQVANLLDCLKKENRTVFTSPTHRLVRERERLVLSRVEPRTREKEYHIGLFARKKQLAKPLPLKFERRTDITGFEIPAERNTASLNFAKLRFPLTLRKWKHGDAFYPLGMKKKKKLSDFFIDQKFSLKEKEHTWLLCSGDDIAWIIGHRIDHRFRVTPATKEILFVRT